MDKGHQAVGSQRIWPSLCFFLLADGVQCPKFGPNWEFLLNQIILYATGHVNRWHWRGSLGGVLPDGFGPNALAAEAIREFVQCSAQYPQLALLPTVEIQRNLERCVRRHINRLQHPSE